MTTTALKLIALFIMLLDHIHQFIPGTPIVLTWLGRISAPLFVFCAAWGFFYTHNRKHYLVNLYIWNIGMAIGDYVVTIFFPTDNSYLINNIFTTLFLTFFFVHIVESFRSGNKKQASLLLLLLIVIQPIGLLLGNMIQGITGNFYLASIVTAVLPNLLMCEGSVIFVAMGVALYYTREKHMWLCIIYTAFCLLFFVPGLQPPYIQNIFFGNYQWMMIGALPLMLCYNGKKGQGFKWLFYVFYPAHIFLLYIIGSLL